MQVSGNSKNTLNKSSVNSMVDALEDDLVKRLENEKKEMEKLK